MAIEIVIKKKVIEDWQNAFPQLSSFAQNKLYKVVGSVVIGLELIKLPRTEEYRPHFVVYPLWEQNLKASITVPIMLKEYTNEKGLQYSIPYQKHGVFFDDVLDSIKKQSPLAFDGNISLERMFFVLDEYSQTPPLSAATNSYLQALLQAAKLKIALFIGYSEAQSVLEQIKKRNWDTNHFRMCGVDIGTWLQSLQDVIAQRDEFLMQIDANKQDRKISQLKSSVFIG